MFLRGLRNGLVISIVLWVIIFAVGICFGAMELKVTKKQMNVGGQSTTVYEIRQYHETLDIDGKKVKVCMSPSQTLTEAQYLQAISTKQAEVDNLTAAKLTADAG